MCSRMAASILKGALPKTEEGDRAVRELVVSDEEGYERSAVGLVNGLVYRPRLQQVDSGAGMGGNGGGAVGGFVYGEGVGRLAELRRLLWESKWSCALFDTRRWVRDLEEAYEVAWERWVRGEGGDIYL